MQLLNMRSCLFIILLPNFLQTTLLSFAFSLPLGNETDRLSLLVFKTQISDPLGRLSSWDESLHFCEWFGVTCGRRHQRVVVLDLSSSQLTGSLSPYIGNLSFLRLLNLENNSFSHSIPQEIGRLSRLRALRLQNNSFGGEIPVNISRCSNLLVLYVGGNNLTGNLPIELGSLSKLQFFVFERNNIVGEMPYSLGNLSFIEMIYGALNNLQGGLPDSIGQLKRLKYFSLGENNMSGTIPPSMYNLSSLIGFFVSIKHFHGELPFDVGQTLPKLEVFYTHTNNFSGPIPATISNASSLSDLQLQRNRFTGRVPTLEGLLNLRHFEIGFNDLGYGEEDDLNFLYQLANNTILEILGINDNNFGGMLPEIVSNFSTNIRRMAFGRNQISGRIPSDIGKLIGLEALGLDENQLTGFIPSSIGKLQNLRELGLQSNKISGNIPTSLGNITSLLAICLSENHLKGDIPSSLGNCWNLLALLLSMNNLSGVIPKEVLSISSLSQYLDLSQNQLTGSLSSEVGKLVHLGYLNISYNRLSGKIPTSLASCISLEYLYLQGNFFQGPIPESLSSLRAIAELNLSYNNMTGQIPKFLGDLKLLKQLDMSFNNLEGEVPIQGVFANARALSIVGNKKLCGGIPKLNLSRCTYNESTKPKSYVKLISKIVIPCAFLFLILVIFTSILHHRRKTENKHASRPSLEISFKKVAYEELYQATGGFSLSNLIGTGSFASVYKGILRSDGVVVAVKVFNLLHKGAHKSFVTECAALVNIRHRNLVKVLTACSSIDFRGNDFKALVYEFMVNGSLEEWLHFTHTSNKAHQPRNLNLIQRLNIAIDVASALDYLHHHCQMPIIHCDLKPSNVLLDGDMTAHVGDFGLARFRRELANLSFLDQTSSICVKGTIGYSAPEYGTGSEVSIHGDVYSYGILLLEMFTGKRPTDESFKDGLNLHIYVKMALPDRVVDVVDPTILQAVDGTSADISHKMNRIGFDKIAECLISIIKVGVACSVELPRERMDISNVVAELHRIKSTVLLGAQGQRQGEIIVLP